MLSSNRFPQFWHTSCESAKRFNRLWQLGHLKKTKPKIMVNIMRILIPTNISMRIELKIGKLDMKLKPTTIKDNPFTIFLLFL